MNKDINYTLTTAFLLLLGVILYYTYMRDSKLYFGSYNNSEHSFSISGKAHIIDGRLEHSILLELFTSDGVGTQILK